MSCHLGYLDMKGEFVLYCVWSTLMSCFIADKENRAKIIRCCCIITIFTSAPTPFADIGVISLTFALPTLVSIWERFWIFFKLISYFLDTFVAGIEFVRSKILELSLACSQLSRHPIGTIVSMANERSRWHGDECAMTITLWREQSYLPTSTTPSWTWCMAHDRCTIIIDTSSATLTLMTRWWVVAGQTSSSIKSIALPRQLSFAPTLSLCSVASLVRWHERKMVLRHFLR